MGDGVKHVYKGELARRERLRRASVPNGPELHRWHHAPWITEVGFNFGKQFAIRDKLCGTAMLPGSRPSGYGLIDVQFPHHYFLQLAFAFRSSSPGRAQQRKPAPGEVRP
jgi:sterol desaturase/sphingolipid hydroxylase (fatty acid hydroxylase superfamily)